MALEEIDSLYTYDPRPIPVGIDFSTYGQAPGRSLSFFTRTPLPEGQRPTYEKFNPQVASVPGGSASSSGGGGLLDLALNAGLVYGGGRIGSDVGRAYDLARATGQPNPEFLPTVKDATMGFTDDITSGLQSLFGNSGGNSAPAAATGTAGNAIYGPGMVPINSGTVTHLNANPQMLRGAGPVAFKDMSFGDRLGAYSNWGGAAGAGLGMFAGNLIGGRGVGRSARSAAGSAVGYAIGNALLPGIGGYIGGALGGIL